MMNLIIPIAFLLASAGLVAGYIQPVWSGVTGGGSTELSGKSIAELHAVERDYNEALLKTREIEVVRDGLLAKHNSIAVGDKEKLHKLLPDHIDSVRLIIDINNIASRYGMSLSNILLSAPGVQSATQKTAVGQERASVDAAALSTGSPGSVTFDSVRLSFSVTGTYTNFVEFLKKLEASLRIVDITALSFVAARAPQGGSAVSQGQGVSDTYTYSVTVRTYYLK